MIHQLEGILLIRIKCYNVRDSYEAKSKTFVISYDFCWVETSAKVLQIMRNRRTTNVNRRVKPARQVGLMNRSKTTRQLNDDIPNLVFRQNRSIRCKVNDGQ